MGQETVSPSLKAWLSLRENVVRVAGTAPPLKMIPCSAPCLNGSAILHKASWSPERERSTKHHGCTMSGRIFRYFAIILGSASIASSRGLKTLALTNGEEPEIEDAGEVALMGLMGWREDTWRMVCFERWYISHSRPDTMKVSSEVIASIIHHPFLLLAFRSSSLCSPLSFFIKGCNLNQIRHFWPDTMRREWFGSHQRQLLGMANAPRQSSGASFWIVKHVEYNQNLARCPLLTTHILSLFSSRSM